MRNKLSKILLLSNICLLVGCNSGAEQNSQLVSINGLQTIQNNEVSFNSKNILPYKGEYFELKDYVCKDDAWKNIIQDNSTHDGITVQAGRTGNIGNYEWLNNHSYISSMNLNNYEQKAYSYWGRTYNFAMRGNFKFNYKPNAVSYICPDIAIAQFGMGGNVWEFYSNIPPHTSTANSHYSSSNVMINCINQSNNKIELFDIVTTGNHSFDIKLYSGATESSGVLSKGEVISQILNTYNSIPLDQRLPLYSGDIYYLSQYNPLYFLVYDGRGLNISFEPAAASQNGDLIITKDEQPIYIGTNTVINCSNVQQTAQTASYSKTISNSITTTAINTLGGELGIEYSGPLMITGGKVSAKVNYSHSWQDSKTETITDTFTASPQSVLLAPLSKQEVTIKLDQLHLNGEYKFRAVATGSMIANGVIYRNSLEPLVFDKDRSGVLNLYEVLSRASKPLEQIEIDPVTKKIYFVGTGKIDGSVAGSDLHVEYGEQLPLTPEDESKCRATNSDILLINHE